MRSLMRWAPFVLVVASGCYRVTHIVLEPKEPLLRSRNETIQMVAHLMTAHTENAEGDVTWSVEDPSIAKISDTGLVHGLASGRTNIVATHHDVVAKIPLEVKFVEKLHADLDKVELSREKGDAVKLQVVATSYDGLPIKDRAIEYTVKDSSICQVDRNGQFWPINEGSTVVTATVDQHSLDIPCTVTK